MDQGLDFEFTTPYAHQQNGTAERSMHTILDATRTIMAESGLLLKYWGDAVTTVVYIRNFIPSSRNPGMIPAELWSRKQQDISYLRPFGTTAYAHVPGDLNLSKLFPRSVKVALLGYFGHDGYKLLERTMGTVFRSCDVIFEEDTIHYARQPVPVAFTDENDPFSYNTPDKDGNPSNSTTPTNSTPRNIPQEIAPRPLAISTLHKPDYTETTDAELQDKPTLPNRNDDITPTLRRSQ